MLTGGVVVVSAGAVVVVVVVLEDAVPASSLESADGEVGAVALSHADSTSTAPPKKTAFFQFI